MHGPAVSRASRRRRRHLVAFTGLAALLLWHAPGLVVAPPRTGTVRVALTRQAGENAKLKKALSEALARSSKTSDMLIAVEVPCIEHAVGPAFPQLQGVLAALVGDNVRGLDLVDKPLPDILALTSPEAARVFLRAWGTVRRPGFMLPLAVACVGKGTSAVLSSAGLRAAFDPSLANAETLAKELPQSLGQRVLYPASDVASTALQEGLTARGFIVERLDVYTTRAVKEIPSPMLARMANIDIATFGSPSAVHGWAKHSSSRPWASCIGGTTSRAAEAAGFLRIFSQQQPSVASWAEATSAAVQEWLAEHPQV